MVSKNMISQSCSFKLSNAATVLAVLLVFVWHTGHMYGSHVRVPWPGHTGHIRLTYGSHTSVVSVALVSCSEELYHTAPNLLTGIVKICSAGLWLRVSVRYRLFSCLDNALFLCVY